MKFLLQRLDILLQVLRLFFPGILLLLIGYFLFNNTAQGKDIIIIGLHGKQTTAFFLIAWIFWVMITWYTSRLIAYNQDKLFLLAKDALYKMPRILGFGCFTVLQTAIADSISNHTSNTHIIIIAVNILQFHFLHKWFESIKNIKSAHQLNRYRNLIWMMIVALIACWIQSKNTIYYLFIIPVFQSAFLFAVITRRKISEAGKKKMTSPKWKIFSFITRKYRHFIHWVFTDVDADDSNKKRDVMLLRERNIFLWFSAISLVAISLYIAAISSLRFARFISPLPIILLSFGILLGAGNILSMLSIKLKINFHLLVITAIIIAGFFNEPHQVQLIQSKKILKHQQRITLDQQFNRWMNERKNMLLDSSSKAFPIYFVLADGGGSRSAYWTASVLETIDQKSNGNFSKNLFCLSGASGGSLGNMTYYSKLADDDTCKHLMQMQNYASNDFLSFPLVHLMGPDLLMPLIPFDFLHDRAEALERSFTHPDSTNEIGAFMKSGFSGINLLANVKSNLPIVCINCTRMQDGSPAVISNIKINSRDFGKRIDVLNLLQSNEDISIATAVSLGARFPYFSPAGKIREQYFVDGGYFDNSGAGVTHEMMLGLQKIIQDSLTKNQNHPYGKIRFHVVHISNEIIDESKITKVHPLINDLAAPVKTILGSYASQTDINNLRLQKYLQEIYKGENTYHRFNLYRKGDEDIYPMNWAISDQARKGMDLRVKNIEWVMEK